MKPLIGINLDLMNDNGVDRFRVNRLYLQAIEQAGGVPLIIPPLELPADIHRLGSMVDGFVFIGGDDYSPATYGVGAPFHSRLKLVHWVRQDFDLLLMAYALKSTNQMGRSKPILGICGGMQLLNIKLKGSLLMDLDMKQAGLVATHRNLDACTGGGPHARHDVHLVEGSLLHRFYNRKVVPGILSSHHQCVNTLGEGLVVTSQAPDGVIEAIESSERPGTIGVQWHPEVDYKLNEPLFRNFVKLCAQPSWSL